MRTFQIGDWLVDPATRRISQGHSSQRLSPKALQVLIVLAEAGGAVVTRHALLDRVWSGVSVCEEVLTQAITELRRAFGDSARMPRFFETVHKSGYRLLLSVRHSAGPENEFNKPLPFPASTLAEVETGNLDLDSYVLFLQGCQAFNRGGAVNTHAAAAMFSEVIDAEPGYAPAYAGLARTLAFINMYYDPCKDSLLRASQACETGLGLAPSSHENLAAQGIVYSAAGDARRSYASFKTALRCRPDCGLTHYLLGRACFAAGDFTLAATILEQAARLNPEDFHSLVLAAKARRRLDDPQGARADLVRALARIEQYLLADPDDFRALADKACCLVELGEKERAFELAETLFRHSDPMSYYVVCFLARAGETAQAIMLLEDVVEAGWSHEAVLKVDPDVDTLRGEMRFRRIEQSLQAH
ncbi:tetratricopeptide repeat protein [Pelagibius litoralis]|uniref:Tetratricopeptide repeat protein n=1 Tax=Pelagibius litoralis TaxID=374515 RepID=A0A967KB44_9PROT|nr:winged helix-turn-helix domain-containing protein [Pelagibius litoralis]NIA70857.1 tetratricopeptide repeat protein [Pelagibius litoralis]